jgi:hypothetical protein
MSVRPPVPCRCWRAADGGGEGALWQVEHTVQVHKSWVSTMCLSTLGARTDGRPQAALHLDKAGGTGVCAAQTRPAMTFCSR